MDARYFRKPEVYQDSKNLVKEVYLLLKKFPLDEKFGLCSQVRRAITSIPINITEGFGRLSAREKAHFLEIASGSLTGVSCELELPMEPSYITKEEFNYIENKLTHSSRQLSALHASVIQNEGYHQENR